MSLLTADGLLRKNIELGRSRGELSLCERMLLYVSEELVVCFLLKKLSLGPTVLAYFQLSHFGEGSGEDYHDVAPEVPGGN